MKINEVKLSDLFADCNKVYNVPLYQREYAWTETEIVKMLTDLWEAFDKDDKYLEGKGLDIIRETFPGGHDWTVWRRCIRSFLPRLF